MSTPRKAAKGRDIAEIARSHEGKPGALLGILEEIQERDEYRHLSETTLKRVAEVTGTPLSAVHSVVTFYSYFNLKPQGKHTVTVCRGTACHTRGSLALLEETATHFGNADFREDEESSFTTEDKSFTVRTVACFGQCALAPVVSVDGVIHSRMTGAALIALLKKVAKGVKP